MSNTIKWNDIRQAEMAQLAFVLAFIVAKNDTLKVVNALLKAWRKRGKSDVEYTLRMVRSDIVLTCQHVLHGLAYTAMFVGEALCAGSAPNQLTNEVEALIEHIAYKIDYADLLSTLRFNLFAGLNYLGLA